MANPPSGGGEEGEERETVNVKRNKQSKPNQEIVSTGSIFKSHQEVHLF
jgi:hypothetical protein